ncbi:hypothetical protein [Halorubrum sp. JWXQ-INN 858]|uniref:hypothetical protein n=1 Tax=Halorubrum sp. JWXQ-INN 858 TaxID=2690782 RepID=UPI00190F5B3C|nr:hypothetical protein [Halorubrum sp. JWXQ-INN 858]
MAKLGQGCREHLEKALRIDDPKEKNFHIRHVLQSASVDDSPTDAERDDRPADGD